MDIKGREREGESMWKTETFSFDIMYYLASYAIESWFLSPCKKPPAVCLFLSIYEFP